MAGRLCLSSPTGRPAMASRRRTLIWPARALDSRPLPLDFGSHLLSLTRCSFLADARCTLLSSRCGGQRSWVTSWRRRRMVASKGIQGVRAMEKLLAVSSAPGAGPALRPVAVAGGVRGYNADAPLLRYERDDLGEDSRRGAHDVAVPNFFSDVFADPVSALQNLGRLLSLMDGMVSPAGRLAAAVWVELQGGRGGAAPEDGHVGPGEGTREGLGIAEQPANQGRGQEGSCTSILHPSLNNYQCISLDNQRKERVPHSVVRRSRRVAGRFAAGSPVSCQQKALIHRLGIAREGEVISEETLQAYLDFFAKPMTDDHIAAVLALFGWTPQALPLVEGEDA